MGSDADGRFASNDLDRYQRPSCERCGATSECDFFVDTKLGDPVSMYRPNRHWCNTPGCVDDRGFNVVRNR